MAAMAALVQEPGIETRVSNVRARVVPPQALSVTGQAVVPGQGAGEVQPRVYTLRGQLAQTPGGEALRYYTGAVQDQYQPARDKLALTLLGSESDGLGATLAPVEPALRKQLKLAEGRGVIVTSVVPGGPAERVKIEPNDILLTLEELPIAEPGDLGKHLKAVGEKPVVLRLLRKGDPVELKVRPRYRVTLAPAEDESPRYFIGVQADPVDDALRSHVKLGEGGLIIREVVQDSPAAKAGVEVGDILLQVGEKPLADVDTLMTVVQEIGPKPAEVKILRGGKPTTVQLTPAPRPAGEEAGEADVVFGFAQTAPLWTERTQPTFTGVPARVSLFNRLGQASWPVQGEPAGTQAIVRFTPDGGANIVGGGDKVDALARQVEELRQAVEALKAAVEKK
jgi:membrane-associated protease RseP (regulator of RpoE activity)